MPGLAGSLVLDDATAAGWAVDGPAPTEAGGLTVTLRHPFTTVQETANLVNSLGPPFNHIAFQRSASDDEVAVAMSGALSLPDASWNAFGDQALITAAGGTPFAAQLDESGATLALLDPPAVHELVHARTATAGMIAKLRACEHALASGVSEVVIVDGQDAAGLVAAAVATPPETATRLVPTALAASARPMRAGMVE